MMDGDEFVPRQFVVEVTAYSKEQLIQKMGRLKRKIRDGESGGSWWKLTEREF